MIINKKACKKPNTNKKASYDQTARELLSGFSYPMARAILKHGLDISKLAKIKSS